MRIFLGTLLLASNLAWAGKPGLYLGAGITTNQYQFPSNHNPVFAFDDEWQTGWRAELGYIWDLGKAGGFQLGVAGTYNDLTKAENSRTWNASVPPDGDFPGFTIFGESKTTFDAQAFGVLLVIQQELLAWMDLAFKIGPAYVQSTLTEQSNAVSIINGETEPNLLPGSYRKKADEWGGLAQLGLIFYPMEQLGIEVAVQNIGWQQSDIYDTDDWYHSNTLSLSAQYRF